MWKGQGFFFFSIRDRRRRREKNKLMGGRFECWRRRCHFYVCRTPFRGTTTDGQEETQSVLQDAATQSQSKLSCVCWPTQKKEANESVVVCYIMANQPDVPRSSSEEETNTTTTTTTRGNEGKLTKRRYIATSSLCIGKEKRRRAEDSARIARKKKKKKKSRGGAFE